MGKTRVNLALVDVGPMYGPKYVKGILAGICRNLDGERYQPRLFVFTDRPDDFSTTILWKVGCDAMEIMSIDVRPFMKRPCPPTGVKGRWACVAMFDPDLASMLGGEPLIYTDVDNVVLGNLTPLIESARGAEFSAHRDWGNSKSWNYLASGFLGIRPGGEMANAVWDYYHAHGREYTEFLFQGLVQKALEHAGLDKQVNFVPDEWVASYKRLTGMMNAHGAGKVGTWDEAIILCFHGNPKPDEVIGKKMPEWERVSRNWAGG